MRLLKAIGKAFACIAIGLAITAGLFGVLTAIWAWFNFTDKNFGAVWGFVVFMALIVVVVMTLVTREFYKEQP